MSREIDFDLERYVERLVCEREWFKEINNHFYRM